MFIERHGRGPRTFLGIHGWSGDHHTFDPLVRDLPSDVSFYAVDLPGCGQSQPPAQWTLQTIADSIVDTIRQIPGTCTLVGNCSGALLGLLASQQVKERIHRMLLIDLFASFPWYFRIFLTPLLGPLAYYSTFANPVGRWITNASLRNRRTAETTLTGGFARTRHASTYRYLQLFDAFPAPFNFSDLTMPIEIVYGERTFSAVPESLPAWRTVWPHARVSCLEGAGHLPILEATAQLRKILFSCPIQTTAR